MFGKDLKAATDRAAAALRLIALTGFALAEDGDLPTAEAFQAHLDGRQQSAIDAATAPLLAASTAAKNQAAAFAAGLNAAGIKLTDFAAEGFVVKEGETLSPNAAAVQAAVELRVTQRSAKTVAASGHPHAVATPPAAEADASADAAATPADAAEFLATHKALSAKDPAKAGAYFRKHEGRFPVS